jgi:hypothetical protein
VICHSEKESATSTLKKTFGYHPLLCLLDNTGEALAGLLREGRAGSNTTADHITVLDQAIAQIPDEHRHDTRAPAPDDAAKAHVDYADQCPDGGATDVNAMCKLGAVDDTGRVLNPTIWLLPSPHTSPPSSQEHRVQRTPAYSSSRS